MAFKMRGFSGFKQRDWMKKEKTGNPMDFVRGQKIKAGKKLKGEADDVLNFGNPRKNTGPGGGPADEQLDARLENIENMHLDDVRFATDTPQEVKAAHRALDRSYKDASADKLYKTKRNTRIPLKQAKPKGGKYQIKSDDKGDYIDTEFGKARSPEYGLYDLPGGVDREGRLMGDDIRFKTHKDHGLVVDHMYEESKMNPDHHAQQAEMEKKRSKSPAKQTSHGPIREYQIPNNPNEGPYIVRSRSTGQTVEPNNDGPDYRHIRERTGIDDGPHPERPKQLRNYDAFKAGAGSPAKKYVSDAQRKAVHASKAERGKK